MKVAHLAQVPPTHWLTHWLTHWRTHANGNGCPRVKSQIITQKWCNIWIRCFAPIWIRCFAPFLIYMGAPIRGRRTNKQKETKNVLGPNINIIIDSSIKKSNPIPIILMLAVQAYNLPVCSHGMHELHVSLLAAMPNQGVLRLCVCVCVCVCLKG